MGAEFLREWAKAEGAARKKGAKDVTPKALTGAWKPDGVLPLRGSA